MKKLKSMLFGVALCSVAAMAMSGCSILKHIVKNKPVQDQKAVVSVPTDENAEPSVRNSLLHSVAEVQTVHFDYDSAALTSESTAILAKNAQWLKDHQDVKVQVAGHCDQRGTEAYNLALGQNRAGAVRKYYGMLGIPGSQIATITYGKEKPLCQEMEESCWQQNRRAETLVAFPADMSKSAPSGNPQP